MTQETKIGLLIGGTFIFCFALVLSHSKDEPFRENLTSLLSSTPIAPRAPQELFLAGQPAEPRPAVDIDTRSPQPSAAQDSPGVVELSEPPSRDPSLTVATEAPGDPSMRQSQPTDPEPTGTDAIANRPLIPTENAYTPPPRQSPPGQTQPRHVLVYVAHHNDNLTRIAKRFFGKATTHHIELIYQANRTVLKDKHSIQVGQKLEIPISGGQPASPVGPAPSKPATAWRWYEVRQKDRYCKIALEQLGDEHRWKDIYALNRDIFPDPDLIRPGVRIKIPNR